MQGELRATLALAWPLAWLILGQTALGTAGLWVAGRLGGEASAAVGLGQSWRLAAVVAGQGVVAGAIRAVAVAQGGGRADEAVRALLRGAALVVLTCVPLGLWHLGAGPGLAALDQPLAVAALAARQSAIGALGLPAALGFYLLFLFLQLRGRVGRLLGVLAAGNALNGALAFGLARGMLGLPELGVDGVAWGLAAAYWCMFGAALVAAWPLLRADWPGGRWPPRASELRALATQALPVGLHWGVEAAIWPATFLVVGGLGADALADHAMLANLVALALIGPLSLEAASMVRVGLRVGARQDWTPAARAALLLAGATCAVALLACAVALERVLGLYTIDEAALERTQALLPLVGALLAAHAAQLVQSGVLRGLGDTRRPALLVLGCGILGLGTAVLLAERAGLAGVWAGLLLGGASTALALGRRLHGHGEPDRASSRRGRAVA